MPDPIQIIKASALSVAVAIGLILLARLLSSGSQAKWTSLASAVGVAIGWTAGAWALGLAPHWPPREDQDRLLLVLLPAVVSLEIACVFLSQKPRLAWVLRLVVAAAAARVLLHGSIYLGDQESTGTGEWSVAEGWLVLAGLGVILGAAWLMISLAAPRAGSRITLLTLALASGGAGVTVMLSGYASGGQLGLVLAASLIGGTGASLFFSRTSDWNGAISIGIIGLFALLDIGRFFGGLTTGNAILLFAAPLLACLPSLVRAERVGWRGRAVLSAMLATLPVALAFCLALRTFLAESAGGGSPGAAEPSMEDYMNFGK